MLSRKYKICLQFFMRLELCCFPFSPWLYSKKNFRHLFTLHFRPTRALYTRWHLFVHGRVLSSVHTSRVSTARGHVRPKCSSQSLVRWTPLLAPKQAFCIRLCIHQELQPDFRRCLHAPDDVVSCVRPDVLNQECIHLYRKFSRGTTIWLHWSTIPRTLTT